MKNEELYLKRQLLWQKLQAMPQEKRDDVKLYVFNVMFGYMQKDNDGNANEFFNRIEMRLNW